MFETLGNATLQLFADGRPVLVTDPWLVGTCYFGSWALDHALTPEQIGNALGSDYVWLSHGHPDHIHHESLDLFAKGQKFLVPDHYDPEIRDFLAGKGFDVTVLEYRRWFRLSPTVEIMCLDNINQDAIMIARLGDALLINQNDSPTAGEVSFLRRLVRSHPNDKTYLAALCSIDADMFNFVDAEGRSLAGPPDERKPGAIWTVARNAALLGIKNFCCSSSQHIYVRPDSIWANDYRISWQDMRRHWSRPGVRLIEPFVTVDIATGAVTANHPEQLGGDRSAISATTGDDDWNATATAEDWAAIERFFRRFELIPRYVDFIAVEIGGERRRFDLNPARAGKADARGIRFHAPRQSFLEATKWGFFDDLLIGNFMKVHLTNTSLYPRFTPLVAKLGGNAKVYSKRDYRKFRWRYFRRNPIGTLIYLAGPEINYVIMPWIRRRAESLGFKKPLKYLYRTLRGDPIVRTPAAITADQSLAAGQSLAADLAGAGPLIPPDTSRYLAFPPAMKPVLVVIVDTEENFDWEAPYSSTSTAVHGMGRIEALQALFDRAGVRPLYMIDYSIASQPEGYRPLTRIVAQGRCEIGAHVHPWVNPPITEEISARNSFPCNLPPGLEGDKLRVLSDTIESNLGVRVRSYKAGRYGIGAATPGILLDQGFKVDLSVVPTGDYSPLWGPDFRGFHRSTPFWLDGGQTLLELPLTTGFIGLLWRHAARLFRVLNSPLGRALHLPGIFARLRLVNRVMLTPEGVTLTEAKDLTRHVLSRGERVLTMAFHSTSLTPGSTPYVGSESEVLSFHAWLEAYLAFFKTEIGGVFMTPLELRATLQDGGTAEQPLAEQTLARAASAE
jgi:hypothetical protein